MSLATRTELDSVVKSCNEGLKLLSKNQETLGKNFNQNLDAIRGAFHFVDAHQHVQRRIMNDMAMGRLQMIIDDDGAPELIDYEWYHRQYQGTRYVILFMEWLRKFLSHDEAEEEVEAPVETEKVNRPLDDFEFGGDYASQNSP